MATAILKKIGQHKRDSERLKLENFRFCVGDEKIEAWSATMARHLLEILQPYIILRFGPNSENRRKEYKNLKVIRRTRVTYRFLRDQGVSKKDIMTFVRELRHENTEGRQDAILKTMCYNQVGEIMKIMINPEGKPMRHMLEHHDDKATTDYLSDAIQIAAEVYCLEIGPYYEEAFNAEKFIIPHAPPDFGMSSRSQRIDARIHSGHHKDIERLKNSYTKIKTSHIELEEKIAELENRIKTLEIASNKQDEGLKGHHDQTVILDKNKETIPIESNKTEKIRKVVRALTFTSKKDKTISG